MSIKINHLKIRMPAGTSSRPESFARDIAQGLAWHGTDALVQPATEHLQLRLRLRTAPENVSEQVTDAVARALRNREQN